MPLEINLTTNEPFIRLPSPHSNIIITPSRHTITTTTTTTTTAISSSCTTSASYENTRREDDEKASVSGLNDPRVALFLEQTPYPYIREHARDYLTRSREDSARILSAEKQQQQQQQQQQHWADGCPFRCIREVIRTTAAADAATAATAATTQDNEGNKVQTKEVLIGDITFSRYTFYEHPPESEAQAEAKKKNSDLPAGHEDLLWGIGFWLLPTYHKRGIMTAALQTIISDWGIPRMNVRVLKASAFAGNDGSVGVFRKCGFVVESTIQKGSAILSEARGGGKRDIVVLRWEKPSSLVYSS